MDIEKAKKILIIGVVPGEIDSIDLAEARGFIAGYATLEKENARLREGIRKVKCPCGETTVVIEQHPNHLIKCIVHGDVEQALEGGPKP